MEKKYKANGRCLLQFYIIFYALTKQRKAKQKLQTT